MKIRAIELETGEVFLLTVGGGYVPSHGGYMTYDSSFLSGHEVSEIVVEAGMFDVLPDLILEESGRVDDDEYNEVLNHA